MGEDTDITEEVRDRLDDDGEMDTDSDGDSDPLFTTDGVSPRDESAESDE